MIGKEICQAILDKALRMSNSLDADFFLSSEEQGLTRFAGNSIHQNVSHSNAQLHIRAVSGKRLGRAVTNDLSDAGITKAVGQAEHNASLMPEDPDFRGIPDPAAQSAPTNGTDSYDPPTATYSPEERAQAVGIVCSKAANNGLNAYGACRTGTQEIAVASTRGTKNYHAGTFAGLLITVMSDSSSGWSKGGSWRVADLNPQALAEEATDKALRGENPHDIEPGEYTVVLDHYAVDDILGALSLYGMGAQAVQERRSWMNGLERERAMSPSVSIWDDGQDPSGWPVPFDAEGVPRQKAAIVVVGVIGDPVHNSYTAGKEGKTSTGHQVNFTGAPYATNLFMKPGDQTVDDLIVSTKRGLYITRFHYTRLSHNKGCVMTGMTRDGTFLIEDGRISHPVKNLRFTQSYVEALAGVEGISRNTKLILSEVGFATRVPALKLKSFNFTGVTV